MKLFCATESGQAVAQNGLSSPPPTPDRQHLENLDLVFLADTPQGARQLAHVRGELAPRSDFVVWMVEVDEEKLLPTPTYLTELPDPEHYLPMKDLPLLRKATNSTDRLAIICVLFRQSLQSHQSRFHACLETTGEAAHKGPIPPGALTRAAPEPFPVQTLYHGTTTDRLPSILSQGLKPNSRPADPASPKDGWPELLYLAASLEEARQIARNYAVRFTDEGQPVVCEVDARKLETYKCFPDDPYISYTPEITRMISKDFLHPRMSEEEIQIALSSVRRWICGHPPERWVRYWRDSLNKTGNIGYRGSISPDKIKVLHLDFDPLKLKN